MANFTTRQHIIATLSFTKADGTPGTVEAGSVTAASSDDTVMTAAVLADGTVDIEAVAAGGPARIVVQADADLGAGVVSITGTSEDCIVTTDPRDQATTVTITMGTPVDK